MGGSRRCDVVRSTFSTPDVERGLESLASAYGTRIRVTRPTVSHGLCRYERRAMGPLALDSITFPADVSYDVEPVGPLMVLDTAARMPAGAALGFFPDTYTAREPLLRGPGHVGETTLRRAAAYIDAHAEGPVALSGIAAAAGVSARALQYGFHRHHGTSPMGYLRRVRLERAHRELQAAGPADGETVAEMAARWGWGKPGTFSVVYRRAYGIAPSTTLRDDGDAMTARS
ncbi:helix-turn-helix domain-containing protein [Streptomyces wuyuanensis]|uniref:helix-turn-helix domain-containing protein n=1 Tax=Streptomyces wuyuanensis TaxID=1196353 RepID=UPI003D72957E